MLKEVLEDDNALCGKREAIISQLLLQHFEGHVAPDDKKVRAWEGITELAKYLLAGIRLREQIIPHLQELYRLLVE